MMAKSWQRPFDDPIPLPRGRELLTLKDAANYIMKLQAAQGRAEHCRMAGRDRGADHGGRRSRASDARTDWNATGVEPQC
jgi:hypothetical protein